MPTTCRHTYYGSSNLSFSEIEKIGQDPHQEESVLNKVQVISSRELIESSNFDIYLINPHTLKIECVSQGIKKSTGYSNNELLNMHLYDLNAVFTQSEIKTIIQPLIDGSQKSVIKNTVRKNRDGNQVPVSWCINQVIELGSPQLIVMISEEIRVESKQFHGGLLEGLMSTTSNAIAITDAMLDIEQVNSAFCKMFRHNCNEIIGKDLRSIAACSKDREMVELYESLTTRGCWEGMIWRSLVNGEMLPIWLRASRFNIPGKATFGYVFALNDNSSADAKIHLLSNHDSLTGLPNRSQFLKQANQCLIENSHRNDFSAILHVDINDFKKVNELFGHIAGNEILKSVAERISNKTKRLDFVANLGADEFALYVSGITSSQQACAIAQRLIDDFNSPFIYHDQQIRITVSIGVALNEFNSKADGQTLLQYAAHAVNFAKCNGKSNIHLFKEDYISELAKKYQIESELHQAIVNQEFELYLQPQLDLSSGKIKSAEALLRWNHPQKGLVQPIDFIHILEESELIIPVGQWVIEEACRLAKNWQDRGYSPIQIAVNVSAVQCKSDELVEHLQKTLAASKLDPRWLEFEITESCVMKDPEHAISTLQKISDLGVGISLDDFGTGFSSLSYLKKLPINVLKVDRSFVQGLPGDKEDSAIVNAIIALSKALNFKVVAEGVETQQQFDALNLIGCEKIQGFLVGYPTQAIEFDRFLEHKNNSSVKPLSAKNSLGFLC